MSEKIILLVEDSQPLRQVLADKLRAEHFSVIEALNTEDALKLAAEKKPNMIITDIVMYPVDGFTLAQKIRDMGAWGQDVHIVALTNQNDEEPQKAHADLHFIAYMVKAETPLDDVVARIKKIFKENKK